VGRALIVAAMAEEHRIVRALREKSTGGLNAFFVVFVIALVTIGLEFLLEYFGLSLGILGFVIVAGCVGVGWLVIIGAYARLIKRRIGRDQQ